MLRGSEDIVAVCKRRIASEPHTLSDDGDFSWEEVECLGVCANAPMVQIWKDTYEDLTPELFEKLLDGFAAGNPPKAGSQIGRTASAPEGSDHRCFGCQAHGVVKSRYGQLAAAQ